ncbi:MAG TPA: tRNA (N6-threonylcarbamoyladenosine(37)-N6)-methyltransferase TrmO [Acidimicrobiales bacterium]|nr:tRNA (N6-threonylcarbamoyladenosine(37)-N6)-methyltransferase TrmO [Acidimicrobiales bacterium]
MPDPIELRPIGTVESELTDRADAPKQADEDAPPAWIVLEPAYLDGLTGIQPGTDLFVLTWLHEAERDILLVHSRGDLSRPETGVFSVRSPVRPNPIGLHLTKVVEVDGNRVKVAALEAIDGTPVLDLKPRLGDER